MGWKKKIFHINYSQKNTGVPAQTSDKLDLKSKTISGDETHYMIIKGSEH